MIQNYKYGVCTVEYLSLPPTRQDLTQGQWPEGRIIEIYKAQGQITGKGVEPSPTPRYSSYWKGAFGSPSTTVANFTFSGAPSETRTPSCRFASQAC